MPVTPTQVIIGGALVTLGQLESYASDSDLTYAFDQAETPGARDEGEDECKCPKFPRALFEIPPIIYINVYAWIGKKLTGGVFMHNLRVKLMGIFSYNGCDVKGATLMMGDSVARLGMDAYIEARVRGTYDSAATKCPECCDEAACVEFIVEAKVTPPLPFQGPRTHTILVTMCGDGNHDLTPISW